MERLLPLRGAAGSGWRRPASAQRRWIRAAASRLPERSQPVLPGSTARWSAAGFAKQCTHFFKALHTHNTPSPPFISSFTLKP